MKPIKIRIPNQSASEFENFDRFVQIVLAKGRPTKKDKPLAEKPIKSEVGPKK